MSLRVQRADSVKESPCGLYMSESTASAMQRRTPQSPGAPGRGTISRWAGEFLMQGGGDVQAQTQTAECTHTQRNEEKTLEMNAGLCRGEGGR